MFQIKGRICDIRWVINFKSRNCWFIYFKGTRRIQLRLRLMIPYCKLLRSWFIYV